MDAGARDLQERIDAALREAPAERAASGFSDYLPGPSTRLARRLNEAAAAGGEAGIAAALDEFDRLRAGGEDPIPLQRALMVFLTHHPAAVELGLRVPDLAERAPWMGLPARGRRGS